MPYYPCGSKPHYLHARLTVSLYSGPSPLSIGGKVEKQHHKPTLGELRGTLCLRSSYSYATICPIDVIVQFSLNFCSYGV